MDLTQVFKDEILSFHFTRFLRCAHRGVISLLKLDYLEKYPYETPPTICNHVIGVWIRKKTTTPDFTLERLRRI